ncbi:MAG: SpoIIE family protein phosphatase [Flammeovirgaceae bacterium]
MRAYYFFSVIERLHTHIAVVFFTVYLLLSSNVLVIAQHKGNPFISRYTPEEYGASRQIFAVVQDSRGRLYIANVDGILIYDGTFWEKIQTPDNSYVRALAIDDNDRVYAGAYNDFGVLEANALGQIKFKSLIHLLPEADRENIENIWAIRTAKDVVYFQGRSDIYAYQNGKITKISYPNKINRISIINDQLYLSDEVTGLSHYQNGEFKPLPNGDYFIGKNIYDIHQREQQKLLLVSRRHGVFQYDFNTKNAAPITEIPSSATTSFVYSNHMTPQGDLALGTWNNGLYLYPPKGAPQVINAAQGLSHNRVITVNSINNQNLFVGTQEGFSYVETATPVVFWNADNGLPGRVTDMERVGDKLFISTESGLFYIDQEGLLHSVAAVQVQDIWDLLALPESLGGNLLIGTNLGVFEYDGQATQRISAQSCVALAYSEQFPSSVFYCSKKLVRLQRTNDAWKQTILTPLNDAWSLAIDPQKNIWVGTYTNGVCRIQAQDLNTSDTLPAERITYYDTTHQLTSFSNKVIDYNQEVIILNENGGVFQFNATANQFALHPRFQQAFGQDSVLLSALAKLPESTTAWFESEKGLGYFTDTQQASYQYINRIENAPSFDTKIYPDQDGVVWVGSAKGLFRYDSKKAQDYQSPLFTHIKKVTIKKDSLIYGGFPVSQAYELPYAIGNIIFKYSATSYDKSDQIRYSYFLEGNDEDWSEWTTETKKEYTNLWEGEYTFRVKAQDRYLNVTEEASFSFEVLAPWYRTSLAYLAYLVVGGLIIWLLLRLNSARLRAANERLEQIVSQRTAELKDKNHEVLQQNEELQQQQEEIITQRDYIEQQNIVLQEHNQKITDSIRYAKTIQTGILPFQERLTTNLKDYFIIYRPKDIVSGDFYWFENVGNIKLFALADCTGHGVPGAFMSMIGAAILNDIVLKSNITSPAKILTELHFVIQKVLKSQNRDGMDIGICAWEEKADGQISLRYAGAKRPLYWVKNGQLEAVKGIRRSIGGHMVNEVSFYDTELTLSPNTLLYLSSDGYVDQNGSTNHRRIGTKKLIKLLEQLHASPLDEQKKALEEFLDDYQGSAPQRDDIALIGFRI